MFYNLALGARDAIIIIDNFGRTTFWNTTAECLFEYSQNEVLGKKIHDLICPEKYKAQCESAFDHFTKTEDGNAIGKTLDFEGLTKSGK